jgi:hypothetical protein
MTRGQIFFVGLGVFSIILGLQGFTRKGLPWGSKNLTGLWGKIIGSMLVLLGLGMIAIIIAILK